MLDLPRAAAINAIKKPLSLSANSSANSPTAYNHLPPFLVRVRATDRRNVSGSNANDVGRLDHPNGSLHQRHRTASNPLRRVALVKINLREIGRAVIRSANLLRLGNQQHAEPSVPC
jgi:hypothetical protein